MLRPPSFLLPRSVGTHSSWQARSLGGMQQHAHWPSRAILVMRAKDLAGANNQGQLYKGFAPPSRYLFWRIHMATSSN